MKFDAIKQLMEQKDITIEEYERNYYETPIPHLFQYFMAKAFLRMPKPNWHDDCVRLCQAWLKAKTITRKDKILAEIKDKYYEKLKTVKFEAYTNIQNTQTTTYPFGDEEGEEGVVGVLAYELS